MASKVNIPEDLSSLSSFNADLLCTKEQANKENETTKSVYPSVSFLQLYKYATALDKLIIGLAALLCTITAICNTVMSLTFGEVTGTIVDYVYVTVNSTNQTLVDQAKENLMEGLNWFVIVTCVLGAVTLIFTYIATTLFNYSALRQTYKMRELFLTKILDQDIPWYDVNQTGDFASRVADDLKKIEEGIGEKVSTFIYYQMTVITSILQGLIMGWELALICMISFPITTLSMGFVTWISSRLAKHEMDAYGEAGAIAEETLSAVRTVVAFGGQGKEEGRYNKLLLSAMNNNIKRSFFNGVSNGIMWFFAYASYSLSFWYGVKLILKDRLVPEDEVVYTAGNMITVFFSILTATWYFGMTSPFMETFGIAKGAAAKIFGIIASEPKINASKGNGLRPKKIEGNIQFKDVYFHYPSRKDVKVLRRLNLSVKSGETVALVGSSGCGKSTCIQLIQRYYDPTLGNVFVDNYNIKDLDLTWLRSHIGVVGQEPVLFETTIKENIRFGNLSATQEDIERAAKKANAHTFISSLPQGYETMVGERGTQLSGGQKQRIAIARALVRKPAILLLDEATSALDTSSEAIVQAALDTASNDCTTIIVAHRLSTVRKSDRIVVISEGKVIEEGSHNELVAKKGAYYQLITAQLSSNDDGDEEPLPIVEEISIPLPQQKSTDTISKKSHSYVPPTPHQIAKEIKAAKYSSSLLAIMKFNSPEWWIIAIGCISAVVSGAGIPVYAIVFGDVMGILSHDDPQYIEEKTNIFVMYFLYIGIASGIATLLQTYMFGIAGEKLTMRLRSRMFKAMLSQEIAWFDNKDNGVGSLCARLSAEAASVQGATGQRIGTVLNALSTIGIAVGISLYYEWRVSLVALVFAPLIVISMYMEEKVLTKENAGNHKSLQRSTKIAVEAISNIRTVASLTSEKIFLDLYMAELIPYQNAAKKNTHFRGIVYGLSRSVMFFAYAASLYYGALLVRDGEADYAPVFIVAEGLISSSWSLASALAFTPNLQKGLISVNRIFELLHRVPKIQNGSSDSSEQLSQGTIMYDKVFFSYPNRPTAAVLKGLDLQVLQGKMVALVGPSGCGKSTIIQLLERFYDPDCGKVTCDGKDVRRMHLSALRSHLGIVSQEPNLFSRTIAENIAYGDNSREVSSEEIVAAAKQANIHNFVASLPLRYDTKLGEKGTQLSGGQKQRIAIARALVRNPKVLLLDEATSALDCESEKVVQEALDNAKVGRTCISIAHRLTTIQDADVICVVNQGRIVEMGTHLELLNVKDCQMLLAALHHP